MRCAVFIEWVPSTAAFVQTAAYDIDRKQSTGGQMRILGVTAQLRTTNLSESIRFYTERIGLTLEFQYQDFYAGIRAGDQVFHLKQVDERDASIDFVDEGGHFHLYLQTDDVAGIAQRLKSNGLTLEEDVHDTEWGTRELVVKDDQGHTLYFGESVASR